MPGVTSADSALDCVRKLQALKNIYLFNSLPQHQLDKLMEALVLQEFHRGASVIVQGEHGTTFHIVCSGELGVFVGGQQVRTYWPNTFFGERALFLEEPRAASVTVLSDRAEVWSIDKKAFKKVVKGNLKEQLTQRVLLHNADITLKDLRHIKVIGAGSFGVVRLVTHVKTGAKYALKRTKKVNGLLPPELVYECKMLAEIDHPFMVYLVKTLETGKHVYMLTELMTGGDLFCAIDKLGQGGVPIDAARFYIGSCCIALEALHARDIVYRDLKPQNVMLDQQGYIKLIDFGTAKKLNGGRTMTAIGTPFYIAPELLRGRAYRTEPDLWSLGVVTYEMLCDQYPFGDGYNDVNKIYVAVLTADLKFPSTLKDSASRSFISGLLEVDPSERLGAGMRGWEEIRESDFFAEAPIGPRDGQTFFDLLQSRELDAPVVPEHRSEHAVGQVYEIPGRSNTRIEASLSDADELAK